MMTTWPYNHHVIRCFFSLFWFNMGLPCSQTIWNIFIMSSFISKNFCSVPSSLQAYWLSQIWDFSLFWDIVASVVPPNLYRLRYARAYIRKQSYILGSLEAASLVAWRCFQASYAQECNHPIWCSAAIGENCYQYYPSLNLIFHPHLLEFRVEMQILIPHFAITN